MSEYTTDAFIAKISNDILDEITATSVPFNIDQTLQVATDTLREVCVPTLLSLYEEYYVTSTDTTLVADQASYDLPAKAIGVGLRSAAIVKISTGQILHKLVEMSYDENQENHSVETDPVPRFYYFEDTKVVLVPTPSSTDYALRLSYHRRPDTLTAITNSVTVASATTESITLSGTPTFAGSNIYINVQSATPHFNMLTEDLLCSITGTAVTHTDSTFIPAVGSIVTLGGYVTIPQLPLDAHPWLAALTSAEILSARGDFEGSQQKQARADRAEAYLQTIFGPRNKGATKTIVPKNGLFESSSWYGALRRR